MSDDVQRFMRRGVQRNTTPGDDDTIPGDDDTTPGDDDDTTAADDDDDTAGGCQDTAPCQQSPIHILSEADLEAIRDCVTLDGDLTFQGLDWLTHVDLPCLESVGSLDISSNDNLTTLSLPHLTHIDGDLQLYDHHSLLTVDGLAVEDNDSLNDILGLANVQTMGNDLFVHDNRCLAQSEAEASTAGIDVGGNTVVHSNGTHYPCPCRLVHRGASSRETRPAAGLDTTGGRARAAAGSVLSRSALSAIAARPERPYYNHDTWTGPA